MKMMGEYYSEDIEESLLGALLSKESVINEIPEIKPDHFYHEKNQTIFKEILLMIAKAEGKEINLDEIDPDIGIKPRDVIQTFKGEFSLAVTDVAIPDGGSDVPLQDAPAVSAPFGGAKETPGDPFGEPSVIPFPGEGAADGPNEEGTDIGDGAPQVEFLFAATIDPAKWEILKTSPPRSQI